MHDLTMSHGCPQQSHWRSGGTFQVILQKESTIISPHSSKSTPKRDRQIFIFTDEQCQLLKHRNLPKGGIGVSSLRNVDVKSSRLNGSQGSAGETEVKAHLTIRTKPVISDFPHPSKQPRWKAPVFQSKALILFLLKQEEVGERVKLDSGPEIKTDTHKWTIIGGKVS